MVTRGLFLRRKCATPEHRGQFSNASHRSSGYQPGENIYREHQGEQAGNATTATDQCVGRFQMAASAAAAAAAAAADGITTERMQ